MAPAGKTTKPLSRRSKVRETGLVHRWVERISGIRSQDEAWPDSSAEGREIPLLDLDGDAARINHRIAGGAGEGVHPIRKQATLLQALQGGTG